MSERGSGQTSRQLQSLAAGDVFVVGNASMLHHTRGLARHLLGDKASDIKIAIVSDDHSLVRLQGVRGRIVFDHAFNHVVGLTFAVRARAFADASNARHQPSECA